MTTVTLRLPDDTCQRLKQLAGSRGVSLNKLMEELGTAATAAHDAEIRFRTMAGGANRQRALTVLDRLDDLDRQGGVEGCSAKDGIVCPAQPRTSARALYQVIVQAARTVDEFMATEGKGIFYVPELSLAFSAWQAIVQHKAELFGDRKLDSQWESTWGSGDRKATRIDLQLHAGRESMLFEFKIKSRTSDYTGDLEKLARPAKEPFARRFFCAMIDEYLKTEGVVARIAEVQKWQNPEYCVRPAVPVQDFAILPKRKHPRYEPTHCIVALWELIPK